MEKPRLDPVAGLEFPVRAQEEAIGEDSTELQQETPAFWRCQYRGMPTTNRSSRGVELASQSPEYKLCMLQRAEPEK